MARPESHMCVLVILNAKMVFSALKNIVKALLSPPPPLPLQQGSLFNFTPQERWAYHNREGRIPTTIKYLSCSQLSTLNSSV